MVFMHFRLSGTTFYAHDGQSLPIDHFIEEINLVFRWAEATGGVQL